MASCSSCAVEAATGPTPTTEEVLQCQFSSWYDTFRNLPSNGDRRTNVTIKSIVLPLPSDFIDFLLSDGVRLPLGATKVSSFAPNEDQDEDDAWSSASEHDEHNDDHSPHQFSFPELNQKIQQAIDDLGGSVVPKLNWSCPRDATWVNNGTLKCQTPGDVYLLLKSSDFVLHDVLHALPTKSTDYKLVLRKWCMLHASMEFRCFVRNHELVAISQRQHTQHFEHLVRDRMMLRSMIIDFFDTVIEDCFPLANYVFDVYVDRKERVWLLDFNVWGSQTDSLLFTWDELVMTEEESSSPEMRVVETELEIHHDPLASYRAPIDTVNLAAISGGDAVNFEEFMAMCEKPSNIRDD